MNKINFNPFESPVNCLHPDIILNPRWRELLYQCGNYTFRDKFISFQIDKYLVYSLPDYRWNPHRFKVTVDDISRCYFTDMNTGECFPMYFLVSCGHCIICQSSKCSSFARRCQYESQLYDCPPVHITMTYDELHVPVDYSVSLRDVQLWKKRFRTALDNLMYGRRIRMAISAEYGKKSTRRPHYHVIVWNLKPDDIFTYSFLRRVAYDCWYQEGDISGLSMCWYDRFTFSPITLDYIPKGCHRSLRQMGKSIFQAFGYVAKYFYKEVGDSVPPGRKPLFHTMSKSKGLGGIGAPFIDLHRYRMRSLMKKEYLIKDKFSDTLFTMSYDRYLLNRVFPSKFSSVPYKLRRAIKFVTAHRDERRPSDYRFWIDKYSRLFPVFELDYSRFYCLRGRVNCPLHGAFFDYMLHKFYDCISSVIPFLDVGEILSVHKSRMLMLSRLFPERKKINVSALSLALSRRKSRRDFEFTQL